MSDHDAIYHENQVAGLCAVHCLNTLLQGPYFTEIDLMTVAQDLDKKEKQLMSEQGFDAPDFLKYMAEESGNVADDGNYSVQVLAEALKVWNLTCIPYTSPEAKKARENPLSEKAFICNQGEHWLTIRKIGESWYNLNSLLKSGPQYLSDFYLSAYIDSLMNQNYSIFVVRGDLPRPSPSFSGEGSWYPIKSISKSGKNVYFDGDEREQGDIKRGRTGENNLDGMDPQDIQRLEAEEIAMALAASLQQPGSSASNSINIIDDEDAELAMALEMSKQLSNANTTAKPSTTSTVSDPSASSTANISTTSTSNPSHSHTTSPSTISKQVPEEPPASEQTATIGFKLPNNQKLQRRFQKSDSIKAILEYLTGQTNVQENKITLIVSNQKYDINSGMSIGDANLDKTLLVVQLQK
eukprot:TRINITY_DN4916_c0_g1_i1.p1 TRINITY_DN4916_c0_g1~~TRINITY_DN4916_c0_g1_i1.p1  ORF type:complete len:410 (-),score=82.22 TRINITY_DN4916_c0_g1_i1:116-1345(-)